MFPFTVVPAYNLPVYASQRPLPDATQDSVRGCSLGFAAAVIADGRLQRACKAQPAQIRTGPIRAYGFSHLGCPTAIRNTTSPHWRDWLKPENRCLVPFNGFAEYVSEPNPETKKKDVVWFALNDDKALAAFAGIWTEFKGDRSTKSKPTPGPPSRLRLSDHGA